MTELRPRAAGIRRTHFPHDGREPNFDRIEKDFEEFIREKGLKLTSQRRRILKKVFAIHHHFTADDIYDVFRRGKNQISRATIYRTVSLLTEGGFLDEVDLGQDRKYFEHIMGHDHHDHILCIRCDKVIEFQEDRIEELQRQVMKKHGFELTSHSLRLFGLCAKCRGTGAEQATP